MNEIYQSLVAVNPVTLTAQICNLFVQLFIVKKFFLDKVLSILDQRREAADRELTDAQSAKAEALVIKEAYEENMKQARATANELLVSARKAAAARSEEILIDARSQAAKVREKASADIAREKRKAIHDAKDEISRISVSIAEKVVGRQLNEADQQRLIGRFIDDLGEAL